MSQLRIVESLLGVSVKQVACGAAHTVAVSFDHQVYAWGCGANGELVSDALTEHSYFHHIFSLTFHLTLLLQSLLPQKGD